MAKRNNFIRLSAAALFLIAFMMPDLSAQHVVTQQGTRLYKNGRPFFFLGTNYWAAVNLAVTDRPRLLRELDHLQSLGIDNLRIMAASEGPDTAPWRIAPALQTAPGEYNEAVLDGLDFLLAEMDKRKMHAVMCLNNLWPWSGGMAQYINWATGRPIPYPPPAEGDSWLKYLTFAGRFFSNKIAKTLAEDHIRFILGRRNPYTGRLYTEDPTIMAWQLANEPRALTNQRAYREWVARTAALIKSLDPHHLVSIGSEGNAMVPFSRKFQKEHLIAGIDYATMHIWVQNWKWYDPARPEKSFAKALKKAKRYIRRHVQRAKELEMPIVLEEFGIARDSGSYDPLSTTLWRDRYYREIFALLHKLAAEGAPVSGANFWAWAGEGRPREPRAIWQPGDDFTGDPPFEHQGWYSVYDTDTSTLEVISAYAEKMKKL